MIRDCVLCIEQIIFVFILFLQKLNILLIVLTEKIVIIKIEQYEEVRYASL